MATHSRILAWKISWTGESGGLLSMGVAESDTTARLHFSIHIDVFVAALLSPLGFRANF